MVAKVATRLFAILARETPLAVVLRRGPSKQVQLIRWDRAKDRFEYGQWLKGRIYERRCDLSPSGDKLIYFAAKYKKPLFSWTAVSRPPYLTALTLWPKGDGWGGGGLFKSEQAILLNHRADEMGLAKGFGLPPQLKVLPFGVRPGWGEDDPIYHERLLRDGWRLTEEGKRTEHPYDPSSKIWWTFDPPITYEKTRPHGGTKGVVLQMQIKGIHEWGGSTYVIEHQIRLGGEQLLIQLGRTDWADWDSNSDLLLAKDGKLLRVEPGSDDTYDFERAIELADFSKLKFEEKTAPVEATKWSGFLRHE
ncbi:MAG: hypothetical protein HYT88_03130 [Candidatus Omnitrophica bacterium]|nr:hypothetical protein [Candidatus Omnitrophota bacterium]MBI3010283.1 hypothetical protein [Candidatus Omnitrophota bacterium]